MSKKFTDIPIGIRRPGRVSWKKGTIQKSKNNLDNILSKYAKRTGQDLVITSGYRSKEKNKKVGGSESSYHMEHKDRKNKHSHPEISRDIGTRNMSKDDKYRLIKKLRSENYHVVDESETSQPHLHVSKNPKNQLNLKTRKGKFIPHPAKKKIMGMELPKKEKEQNVIDHLMSPLEKTINKKYPISRKPASEPVSEAPKPYPDEGQETENITNAIEAVHGTSQFSGKADKGISFQDEPLNKMQLDAAEKSPALQQTPPEVKEQAKKELLQPGEQERIKEQSKVGGNVRPMDQLKEALMYFGPQIAATLLVGPEAGAETGKLMEGYRSHLREQEKLALQREASLGKSGLAAENLKVRQGNLKQRIEEVKEQRKRTKNLQEDRKLRKEERKLNREKKYLDFTDKQKEMFSNRNDVKTYRERKNKYQAILNLTNFKEGQQLPGGINALIARSVSGEVGVLTDADVQRAQINPDLISKLKRGYFTNIRGTMSPKDTEDIKLLVRKIMAKDNEIMKEKARLYTQAKKKWLPEKYQKSFEEDLITGGLGIDITKKVKPKLTPDQRKRLEYLRAKHRK